jgi:hypothetical protein
MPVVRTKRKVVYRKRSQTGPVWAALAVLAAVAGGLAYSMLRGGGETPPWGTGAPGRDTAPTQPVPAVTPTPPGLPPPALPVRTPEPADRSGADPVEPTRPAPTPAPPSLPPSPLPEPTPDPMPEPVPAASLDDAARRELDTHLAAALAGMRAGDARATKAALEAAARIAAPDADAAARVARWELLETYAAMFRTHRDRALAAAAQGRDYEIDGRVIAVIDVDDQQIVYRDKGRNERVPRDEIPEWLVLAIVEGWYAGNPQPGNAMSLGSYHATKSPSDRQAAREQWTQAMFAGEPTGRALLDVLKDPLLDDPAERAAAPE